ncbi:MAG TPA: hypothetical protein VKU86_09640 [Acidimicrobiales bacterium]|nr:hypothetical protein [Acidimicrobiales bacterium]
MTGAMNVHVVTRPAPDAGCGLAVTLPRSASVTEALLALPPERALDGATALAGWLRGELAALAAELPPGPGLSIDAWRLLSALRHPEHSSVSADDSFVPSPRICRRAVGIAAVSRCVRGWSRSPASAVAEVLAAAADDATRQQAPDPNGPPWWAAWYLQLPSGGRAAVAAEAVTWATQLFSAFEWDRFDRPPVIGGRDDWWRTAGGRLALQGRVEVRAQLDGTTAFAVVAHGWSDTYWRTRLGFPALVSLLARGERAVPGRVVGIWPASGQIRVLPVDIPILRQVADSVLAAAATLVDARLESASGAPRPRRGAGGHKPRDT